MSPSRRQEQRKAETRAELIEAAATVFTERGYHSASLQEVAQRAGFTTGAIYGHFRNKDDLFLAVFEQFALSRVSELGEAHDAADRAFGSGARALADQWMARHEDNSAFTLVAMEFAVHAIRHPPLREALADRYAAVRLTAARMLEQDAEAAGVTLPMPALELATVLRELGVGLALAKLVDPDAVSASLYGDFVGNLYRLLQQHSEVTPAKEHHARDR
jgi:AcrR family transcriptional regulator